MRLNKFYLAIALFIMILGLFGYNVVYDVPAYNSAEKFYHNFQNDIFTVVQAGEESTYDVSVPASISDIRVVNKTIIIVSYNAGLLKSGNFQPINLKEYGVINIEIRGYTGPGDYDLRIAFFRNGKLLIEFTKR